MGCESPELTIILVNYNTRALTLKCLETVFEQTRETAFRVVVWDNASADGSADAVAERFPQVELIRSAENVGFARANNAAASQSTTPWLLLLNTDTEVLDHAIDRLLAFAKRCPENGVYGGRTLFPDGSLNMASCWNRITPWSAFCLATGLTALFRETTLFNPEAIGAWKRDTVREVDIVTGCFFLVRRDLWSALDGLLPRYWMYGEEADFCLRAKRADWRPVVTPEASIVHLGGASANTRAGKTIQVAKARATLMKEHWPPPWHPWGRMMLWLWIALRCGGFALLAMMFGGRFGPSHDLWIEVWRRRGEWIDGYPEI